MTLPRSHSPRALLACLLGAAIVGALPVAADTTTVSLAASLCRGYDAVESVSCEVEKTTTAAGRSVKWLSRVYYRHDNRIHVENVAPAKRRIIADGKTLFYFSEGDKRGYSKPVDELTGPWWVSLHAVPGSPMEHLLQLRDLPEQVLEPEPGHPVRRGYQAEKVYVVLSCDPEGRLAKVEFFKAQDLKDKTGEYQYGLFEKVSDQCWIPCLHKATMPLPDGGQLTETRRILNLEVNKPIAPALFDPAPFFKDVEFTGDFDKTYTE